MQLDDKIFQTFKTINWFSNCGIAEKFDFGFPVGWVPTLAEAVDWFSSNNWEDTTLQARNALTFHLAKKYQNDYQDWNKITKLARKGIVSEIMPSVVAFQERQKLNPQFCDTVRWDLLAAVMESTYKHCNPPVFFKNLVAVYSEGHYPCGWRSERPNGCLMVI